MIEEIQNKIHLDKLKKENNDFIIIIFYADSSEKSKKAFDILKMVKEENPKAPIFGVNASKVKDIHPIYGINTVPAVLVLKKGKISNIIYGVQDKRYYEMLLYNTPISTSTRKEGEKQHRIVVYTSPTCSWCGAVKSYFKKNHIFFREVDISRDIKAGQDLVRRSGQMGIPQTEIDGRIVVGFDKPKLDAILGTKSR